MTGRVVMYCEGDEVCGLKSGGGFFELSLFTHVAINAGKHWKPFVKCM